jgi:hypothetical protein
MPVIPDKTVPILKTREQLRRQDFIRDACKFVNSRMKLQAAVKETLKQVRRTP